MRKLISVHENVFDSASLNSDDESLDETHTVKPFESWSINPWSWF